MRKIKNTVFLLLALMPILTYLLVVFRTGDATSFATVVQAAFGQYGGFFSDILSTMFSEGLNMADSAGVITFVWLIGYYISLILVYLVFSLFTFLLTVFSDRIDRIRGGK